MRNRERNKAPSSDPTRAVKWIMVGVIVIALLILFSKALTGKHEYEAETRDAQATAHK